MVCERAGMDQQPKVGANPLNALYFIVFCIFGTYFLMNLFIGVIMDNFDSVRKSQGGLTFLSNEQRQWYILQEKVCCSPAGCL